MRQETKRQLIIIAYLTSFPMSLLYFLTLLEKIGEDTIIGKIVGILFFLLLFFYLTCAVWIFQELE
jgi:hypothetical protein